MPKKSREYWQKRFEEVLVNNEKSALSYEKEMARIYEGVKQDLQKELESFYQRYSTSTGLDLAEVRKRLNPSELKRFRIQQKAYLDKVRSLIEKGADLSKYEETLKKLSAKAYVSRLQELQSNLNAQITMLTGEQQVRLTNTLGKAYLDGYFQSVFAMQQGLGFGYSFTVPNNEDVAKILKTPWNGNNYSDSIWNNKAKLTNWLSTDLARHFAAGSSVQQMSKDLMGKVDTNYKNAVRLVRTEVNYISNQSTMDAYEEQNVDKYEILATLDSRTSEICRDMDGKIYKTSERKVSVNMPPFHVHCRTTTIPYFEDEDLEGLERAARDDKGNYYTVPAHMNYDQWNGIYGQGAKVKQGKTVVPKEPVKLNQEPVQEREYNYLEQDDIDKWSDGVVSNLTKEQKEVIEQYTGESYYSMNAMLRGKITEEPYLAKRVDTLRSAMSEMPEDAYLYRVMSKFDFLKTFKDDTLFNLIDTYDEQAWTGKLAGKLFKDKAFQSTSWTTQSSYIQARSGETSIMFKIKTPKGTKALPVEKISSIEGENEIILDTGNTYVITGIRKTEVMKGDQITVDCVLLEGI